MAAISADDIKAKVVGIGPWLTAAAALPSPQTYTDANIMKCLAAAIRQFETDTQFTINPVQVWTHLTFDNPNPYSLFVVQDDPYTYYDLQANDYFRVRFNRRPVLSVQRVRMMFGLQTIYTIPTGWFGVNQKAGIFHVVPQFGSLAVASAAAQFQLIVSGYVWKDYLPGGIGVDYIAGLPTTATGGDGLNQNMCWYDSPEWSALRRVIEQYAAVFMLTDIKNLADAGLRAVSTSGAGASQMLEYTRFSDAIDSLMAAVTSYKVNIEETEVAQPFYSV